MLTLTQFTSEKQESKYMLRVREEICEILYGDIIMNYTLLLRNGVVVTYIKAVT
jgi:hypothetical protein